MHAGNGLDLADHLHRSFQSMIIPDRKGGSEGYLPGNDNGGSEVIQTGGFAANGEFLAMAILPGDADRLRHAKSCGTALVRVAGECGIDACHEEHHLGGPGEAANYPGEWDGYETVHHTSMRYDSRMPSIGYRAQWPSTCQSAILISDALMRRFSSIRLKIDAFC